MFEVVRQWWEEESGHEQSHLEDSLSMEGVKEGKNHEGENPPGSKSHPHLGCSHSNGGEVGSNRGEMITVGASGMNMVVGGRQGFTNNKKYSYQRRQPTPARAVLPTTRGKTDH